MSQLKIVLPNDEIVTIKATPTTSMASVLADACAKRQLDPASHSLQYGKPAKEVDLSLPVRYAGLPSGQKLRVVRRKAGASRQVTVALQTSSGRVIGEFDAAQSLWSVLDHFAQESDASQYTEKFKDNRWQEPVLTVMNKPYSGVETLVATTLASIGLVSGRHALRLSHKPCEDASLNSVERVREHVVALRASVGDSTPIAKKPRHDNQDKAVNVTEQQTSKEEVAVTTQDGNAEQEDQSETQKSDSVDDEDDITATNQDEDRNVAVFGLSSAPRAAPELPDEFYEVTTADVRAAVRSAAQEREKADQLATSDKRKPKQPAHILLRIRFPDRIELEARFSAKERVRDVERFVRRQLRDSSWSFYLFVTPPRTVFDNPSATLSSLQLGARAVMWLAFNSDDKGKNTPTQPFLADKWMSQLSEKDFVDLSSLGAAANSNDADDGETSTTAAKMKALVARVRGKSSSDKSGNDAKSGAAASSSATAEKKSKIPSWLKLSKKHK